MYIPVSFFGTQNSNISASGGDTGMFESGGFMWKYHKFDGNNYTSSVFTIYSGSTNQAKLLIVGGGGGGASCVNSDAAAGGGGAGGVVYYDQITIGSGSYTIQIGKGGIGGWSYGFLGSYIVIPPTNGEESSVNFPYGAFTPFTSSLAIAFGGGHGGVAGTGVTSSFGIVPGGGGASGGGNAQNNDGYLIDSSSCISGYGNIYGGPQGNFGGSIIADPTVTNQSQYCITGGGGAGSPSLSCLYYPTAGFPSPFKTDGGDGLYLNLDGTSSWYAGGAGSYSTRFGSSNNGNGAWPNPGGGSAGTNSAAGGGSNHFANSGSAGIVIFTYPYYYIQTNELVRDGLVLWNNCQSFSSSVWYDVSGNNNHAIVSGSQLFLSGSYGYRFNGTNNYLTYPTTLTATPSSSWSMIWYGSFYDDGVNRDLFTKDYYTNGWDTIWDASGSNDIVFRDDAGQDAVLPTTYVVPTKTLYTLTLNATTDTLKLYKNGNLISTATKSINNFNASAASPFRFGWNSNSDATYFKGAISDLLLYNKELDIVDIKNNYGYFVSRSACSAFSGSSYQIDYLVVGGGGGGGITRTTSGSLRAGGGGGGGQFISGSTSVSASTTYSIVVGSAVAAEVDGTSTSALGFTAIGGGAGRTFANGNTGSCGGGAGVDANSSTPTLYNGGTGSAGFNGGDSWYSSSVGNVSYYAGGGGGSMQDGKSAGLAPLQSTTGSYGGAGKLWLDGKYYAAGGGGGAHRYNNVLAAGPGGSSIGGNGASDTLSATAGSANRGAGGGGGRTTTFGGSGSAGVVIIRYSSSLQIADGGIVSQSADGYFYHTFTSSADFISSY